MTLTNDDHNKIRMLIREELIKAKRIRDIERAVAMGCSVTSADFEPSLKEFNDYYNSVKS